MEVARIVMVIGGNLERWLKKREQERLDRAVANARLEERAEVQRKWAKWNHRRLDAEARGEPFIEPPPDASSDDNGKV